MPTIRIDDEVYIWLQKQAKPFEDTPNTVLRRLASIDAPKTEQSTEDRGMNSVANRQLNGRTLNQRWKVSAKHALYHKDGTWFNNLKKFPGALFDPNGYVIFKTKEDYLSCPHLKISEETNVTNGISRISGYVRMN